MKYDNINDFFKATTSTMPYSTLQDVRPRICCKDGFSFSVQAGAFWYCEPRIDNADYYTACEVGFPSTEEPLIYEYAEDNRNYLNTVYIRVPVELINRIILKHGGYADL